MTLETAVIHSQDQHSKAPRVHVDVAKVVAALLATQLEGWKIIRQDNECGRWDGGVCSYVNLERDDGLRLHINASTNYGREAAISVSMGNYSTATEPNVDLRWYTEKALGVKEHGPKARMNIAKLTPDKLAKAIVRRVIVPAEKVFALIVERQNQDRKQLDKKQTTMAALRKLEGVKVEHAEWNKTDHVSAGDMRATVQADGSLRIEHFYVNAEDAVAFCKAVRGFKRNTG